MKEFLRIGAGTGAAAAAGHPVTTQNLEEIPEGLADTPQIVHVHDPDERDRRWLVDTCGIHPHAIDSALDPDEISRFEVVEKGLDLIWKIPGPFPPPDAATSYPVESVGCFLRGNRLIITTRNRLPWIDALEQGSEPTLPAFLLRLFLHTDEDYLHHLKQIKHAARDMQGRINRSMENEHLLKIFDLTERLVYYLDAIDSNLAMLERLREHMRASGGRLDRALLRRVLIETRQAAKQAQIYSQVFAELMDARGTIVNNNMNVLIKNLTIINIIFLPLNLIAGIGGMSEFTLLTRGTHWAIAYGSLLLAMALTGWLTWLWILKGTGRRT